MLTSALQPPTREDIQWILSYMLDMYPGLSYALDEQQITDTGALLLWMTLAGIRHSPGELVSASLQIARSWREQEI